MNDYKLPYSTLHGWTLSMISELIEDNSYRARKYDLRVACNYRYKKFYYKIYLGENVVLEQETNYQTAHYAIAEMHRAFHYYLNEKDKEFQEFCDSEKKNWMKGQVKDGKINIVE